MAIAAAISPYASARDEVRALACLDGIQFVEVFVDAPLDSLVARDVKGLYRRALDGEVRNFTGISDPYERPVDPDVTVFTDCESIQESTTKILRALADRGVAVNVEFADANRRFSA